MRSSCCLFIFLLAILTPAAGGAAAASLDSAALRDLFVGNTATFVTSDLSRVEAYLASGGELRGRYAGDEFSGSWSIEDGRLCLDFPWDLQ